MVGNNENIYVDFDYNNITIVDPNKVVDANGKIKERYVNQEDLVFYANLECKVIPRTKLAIGVSNSDQLQTISVASINFLKPGGKKFLDDSYTNEITGSETITGQGVNQPKQNEIKNPKNPSDTYIRQTINSNGKPGVQDNGFLGIINISVRQGLDFLPSFTIVLEDVKGRAMFEAGDNSPYAAFFNLPYPMFTLTLKGYFGKAVKYNLMLQSFNSQYDSYSGNYKITLKFYTYKYTILSEITMQELYATPHMFTSRFKIQPVQISNSNTNTPIEERQVTRGFEKIKELFSEYKSKGLIPEDFPEITVYQLKDRLENFTKNILDSFTKQNRKPLDDLKLYQDNLQDYYGKVYGYVSPSSWFNKYMDKNNPIVLNNGYKIYTFNKIDNNSKINAKSELKGIIEENNQKLAENETLGTQGKYTINNKTKNITITNSINTIGLTTPATSQSTFIYPQFNENDVNWIETYKVIKNTTNNPSNIDIINLKKDFANLFLNAGTAIKDESGNLSFIIDFFIFEGKNSFSDLYNKMNKDLKVFKEQIETDLTVALSGLLQTKDSQIGFVPNMRNVLAVIFANGEAFLRLMDEVHTEAWAVRDSKERKNAIFNSATQIASQDNLDSGNNENLPVYPWPQMIKVTDGTDGHEQYEIVYPGDNTVISLTQAFEPSIWPEVEFVEEYIKAIAINTPSSNERTALSNEVTDVNRTSLNAIEFPVDNQVFANKEEVKFFYELYERVLMNVFYSGLIRSNQFVSDSDKVSNIIADSESINVINSLGNDSPYLISKLKEYAYNGNNFELVLRNFSNNGTGQSWQNYIRGIFNTPYIKNYVDNSSFSFINDSILIQSLSNPLISLPNEESFSKYISDSTSSNLFGFLDTYPFTNYDWDKKYLASGFALQSAEQSFDTRTILNYSTNNKVISNILKYDAGAKPLSNFLPTIVNSPEIENYLDSFKIFYEDRSIDFKNQFYTEGNLNYTNYSGSISSNQTVSILNTPYFVNAIQEGIDNFRNFDPYPFVSAAYLFINSLPLSTLREKYKTNNESEDLSYIFATLKKFSGIHKLPYAWILKYGSIWHRYKKYVEEGVDILDNVWKGFDYIYNYDPVTSDPLRNYTLDVSDEIGVVNIVLEKNVTLGTDTSTTINTGFYPKLINDFNVFFQGYQIFSGYTDFEIQEGFKSGFTLDYSPTSTISKTNGFDKSNNNRNLKLFPWSAYINTADGLNSFIIPSDGLTINQINFECFDSEGFLTKELLGNQSVYDGSVRTFWSAPNYGYFDNEKVKKPSPFQYNKEILSGQTLQENFSINGLVEKYSYISEIFSVFDKNILDLFETEFLNFCKSQFDFLPLPQTMTESENDEVINNQVSNTNFKNFQLTAIELFKIQRITGNSGTERIQFGRQEQLKKLTQTINSFINFNDYVIKYGNPSNFDKKLFYSFSSYFIEDPYTFTQYTLTTPQSLPVSGGTVTLLQSKLSYPEEWKTLETYVGFSEIPELVYSDNGSYITDFFIDLNISFDVLNIINFTPIIKIYATQKLKDKTLTPEKFTQLLDAYIQQQLDFKNRIFDSLIIKIQKGLPTVVQLSQSFDFSELQGDQTKVELWETFKALNDKWISGMDLTSKTLFEDVMLLDRASRNIGEKIIVDIYGLIDNLTNLNPKVSMQSLIQTILINNNFQIMNLPSYVNFYNVQEVTKNAVPKSEGILEFADTLFGNFLNVDYRDSSPKMVCFYAGKPSEQLDLKNNVDYRFRNDAFDLSKPNPLVEDLTNKNDYDKSNKVVGFNVDIGPQNQSIFHSFSVSQDAGLATAESLEVIYQMANGPRKASTQSNSLYNLYKNRSYKCNIAMMGNALIQPTMYFNLRHVPMFTGPYMILEVNHQITPGNFETTLVGIRQPTASLPKIDGYLQILRDNLLKSILSKQELDTINQEKNNIVQQNVIAQANDVVDSSTEKDSTTFNKTYTEKCLPQASYKDWNPLTSVSVTSQSYQSVKNMIVTYTTDIVLQHVIFATFYLATDNNGLFKSNENNFAGISIDQTQNNGYGTLGSTYFKSGVYYCSKSNIAYATFNNLESSVRMLVDRWKNRVIGLNDNAVDITKFWVLQSNTPEQRPENVYTQLSDTERTNIEEKVKNAILKFDSAN